MIEVPETVELMPGYYRGINTSHTSFIRIYKNNEKEVTEKYDKITIGSGFATFISEISALFLSENFDSLQPCTEDDYCDAVGQVATILRNNLLKIDQERLANAAHQPKFTNPNHTNQ